MIVRLEISSLGPLVPRIDRDEPRHVRRKIRLGPVARLPREGLEIGRIRAVDDRTPLLRRIAGVRIPADGQVREEHAARLLGTRLAGLEIRHRHPSPLPIADPRRLFGVDGVARPVQPVVDRPRVGLELFAVRRVREDLQVKSGEAGLLRLFAQVVDAGAGLLGALPADEIVRVVKGDDGTALDPVVVPALEVPRDPLRDNGLPVRIRDLGRPEDLALGVRTDAVVPQLGGNGTVPSPMPQLNCRQPPITLLSMRRVLPS